MIRDVKAEVEGIEDATNGGATHSVFLRIVVQGDDDRQVRESFLVKDCDDRKEADALARQLNEIFQ